MSAKKIIIFGAASVIAFFAYERLSGNTEDFSDVVEHAKAKAIETITGNSAYVYKPSPYPPKLEDLWAKQLSMIPPELRGTR